MIRRAVERLTIQKSLERIRPDEYVNESQPNFWASARRQWARRRDTKMCSKMLSFKRDIKGVISFYLAAALYVYDMITDRRSDALFFVRVGYDGFLVMHILDITIFLRRQSLRY